MKVNPGDSSLLPDGQTLKSLELHSRHHGSGVRNEELIGTWHVWHVWGRKSNQPSPASGALRALAGTLMIQTVEEGELTLVNSVSFGLFKLCFSGPGHLMQKRPLLVFQFTKMQLQLAGRTIFSLTLPSPAKGKEPFFALIASANTPSGLAWLAARGRGGGLALWVQEAKEGS